ncbi:MAG TPA: hypothetical protein VF832_06775, partial [Longimicrobiales bacterium]
GPAGLDLLGPFAARFLAADSVPAPVRPRPLALDLRRFAGTYRSNHYPHGDVTTAMALMLQFPVRARADGTLDRWGTRWVPVAPLRFRRLDSDEEMVFQADARGRVTRLLAWNGVFDRIPWYETRAAQAALAGAFALVFLGVLLVGLVRSLRWWRSGRTPPARLIRRLAVATSALNLVFLVWFAVGFTSVGGQQLLDLPRWILALLCLPLISLAATLVLLLATARVVAAGRRPAAYRARAVSYAVIAWAFLAWLHYWNLIGFHV